MRCNIHQRYITPWHRRQNLSTTLLKNVCNPFHLHSHICYNQNHIWEFLSNNAYSFSFKTRTNQAFKTKVPASLASKHMDGSNLTRKRLKNMKDSVVSDDLSQCNEPFSW